MIKKMSNEEKEIFLKSTPHIHTFNTKDRIAFETVFGKQTQDTKYKLLIDNRSQGQKAYLIDGN